MDALFCSVINVISVNGFFKSLHILLPLSLMSLHGICTRRKQELERDKAEPRRCGIKSIVSERYSCTGISLLRWGVSLGETLLEDPRVYSQMWLCPSGKAFFWKV